MLFGDDSSGLVIKELPQKLQHCARDIKIREANCSALKLDDDEMKIERQLLSRMTKEYGAEFRKDSFGFVIQAVLWALNNGHESWAVNWYSLYIAEFFCKTNTEVIGPSQSVNHNAQIDDSPNSSLAVEGGGESKIPMDV